MKTWLCVNHCGACCHLDPRERPELESYLTPEALAQYLSLVGPDGWCVHYDPERRQCQIYDRRPRFCRVLPETFEEMFGVGAEEFEDFAIACCQEQIAGVYGADSAELARYNEAVAGKPG
ncbi:MAG: YkgJ family cysteine cluster protein [Cyanobacteria bacterium RI_101]|nr:YkgJ family cysteine cluster protein [Cyanobacteria bacterium RI_101]